MFKNKKDGEIESEVNSLKKLGLAKEEIEGYLEFFNYKRPIISWRIINIKKGKMKWKNNLMPPWILLDLKVW